MDWLVDETILLALCLPLAFVEPSGAYAVVGVLAAIAVSCIAELAPSKWARMGVLIAYLVVAIFFAPLAALLPVVSYQCVRQPFRPFRFAWLISVVGGCLFLGVSVVLPSFMLCVVAAVLSIRTARNAAEKRVLRLARDGIREQLLDAEQVALALADESEAHDGAGESKGSNETDVQSASAGEPWRDREPRLIDCLTDREQAIAGLVAEGFDNKEIAAELYLGEGTVRNHISAILQKCHLKNRTQVAIMYLRETR